MNNRTLILLMALSLLTACQWVSNKNNPSRIRDSEKNTYKQCLQKNNNDTSKCETERKLFLERQEMELMDNNG